ncbi:hypothetical protein DFH09DRAFT_1289076 [Mycena vulgaris]|nr:hypothetical protein DFH09DRAFT_1289076 [Mycena vulgaris]
MQEKKINSLWSSQVRQGTAVPASANAAYAECPPAFWKFRPSSVDLNSIPGHLRKYGFNAVCGRIFDGRNGVRYGKTRPVQWRSGRADGTTFDAPSTWCSPASSNAAGARSRQAHRRIAKQARKKARKKTGYDSEATRRDLARLFNESFKKPPYKWQIDVTEAFLLVLEVVLIAGTGAGKTIPFMMPLLLRREKYSLVISPLKVLQEDQLKDPTTGKRALGTIIDEAHCASQWRGDFRPHYALLNKLRAILPVGSPILAASATLSPFALKDICSSLDLDLNKTFFLNLETTARI